MRLENGWGQMVGAPNSKEGCLDLGRPEKFLSRGERDLEKSLNRRQRKQLAPLSSRPPFSTSWGGSGFFSRLARAAVKAQGEEDPMASVLLYWGTV